MFSYNYTDEFNTALNRSAELGLSVPNVAFTHKRFYDDHKILPVINNVYRTIGNPDGTVNLVGQCLNVHGNIWRDVGVALGCGCHMTVGYIQEGEQKYFAFEYSDVAEWLKNGIDINNVNLHAWLTLDSMEIIDLTWPTTRAKILKVQEGAGAIITKHPDEFINGLQYHPLIVSNDFMVRIRAVQGITIKL